MVGRTSAGDPRGVSPVIGTVLLVAVVVTLAATVGVYAFGLTDQHSETAPQVAITTTYDERTAGDGQTLTVEFHTGDTLAARNVSFVLTGATAVDESTGSEDGVELEDDVIGSQAGSEVAAGEEVVIDQSVIDHAFDSDEYLYLGDAELRLVWDPVPEEVDHSEVIWRWDTGSRPA